MRLRLPKEENLKQHTTLTPATLLIVGSVRLAHAAPASARFLQLNIQ